MRLVLIGAPGSGKGTQGERLVAETGAQHIATGDLLRAEQQAGSKLGREVGGYLNSGSLVPDEVLFELVLPLVRSPAGYILDGFPRSVAQAERFAELTGPDTAPDRVLYLQVAKSELVARLLRRAGEQGRPDDTEAVIRHRLQVFDEQTSPLIDYYRQRDLLAVVDGGQQPDAVYRGLLGTLGLR